MCPPVRLPFLPQLDLSALSHTIGAYGIAYRLLLELPPTNRPFEITLCVDFPLNYARFSNQMTTKNRRTCIAQRGKGFTNKGMFYVERIFSDLDDTPKRFNFIQLGLPSRKRLGALLLYPVRMCLYLSDSLQSTTHAHAEHITKGSKEIINVGI